MDNISRSALAETYRRKLAEGVEANPREVGWAAVFNPEYRTSQTKTLFQPEDVRFVLWEGVEPGDYCEESVEGIYALRDGRFGHVDGWCDTSGWGCQDGVSSFISDTLDALLSQCIPESRLLP